MRIAVLGWHGMVHTRRFARFFAAAGHEVHVVTCGGGDVVDILSGGDGQSPYVVHELGPPSFGKAGYLAKIPRARRLVRTLQPDVIHAHTATSYGLLAAATGIHPLVVTTHGSDVLVSTQNPAMRSVVQQVLRRAELITAPAEHMRLQIESLIGAAARDVLVLQYGVETSRLLSLGAEIRGGRKRDDVRRLVTARPLTNLYHTDLAIRALTELGDEWTLEIAGEGPARSALERLVAELGLADRVTFHGFVPDESAIHRLIASADVYLSMAESDGVSIALLEALALGTIPVLRDIPSNRAWIEDGVSGVLSEATPGAIAMSVRQATGLDAAIARRANQALVRERADRAVNLGALLHRLEALHEETAAADATRILSP
jgi:glycosyltransferase involved in cell wall biosynthesis